MAVKKSEDGEEEELEEEETLAPFEIYFFFFKVMEFQLLLLIVLLVRFLEEKTSLFKRGIFLLICLKCLICLGFSEMNYFNHLLSILKNPYGGFSESLPGISRILTVDFPNPYRWWL